MTEPSLKDPGNASDVPTTIMVVRENMDGYWYIGAGKSIAEGPYRYPQQLLSVAADLLALEPRWRIDVFDSSGKQIMSYSSDQLHAAELDSLARPRHWGPLNVSQLLTQPRAD